jgi:4-diphosphocytidyl-2-C-methyl-D-erythritol kinase
LSSPPKTAEAFAPAKINLTLHVTHQREDGYHLLDSLVVFVDVGDSVYVEADAPNGLMVTGPFSEGVPTDASNLVMKAKAAFLPDASIALRLEKHLPPASGIGGGSSDAAATLRALSKAFDRPLPAADQVTRLGADVPVCLRARPTRMRGIGDQLDEIEGLPPIHMVLVNPKVEVPTPEVFAALSSKTNRPMPEDLPDWDDAVTLAAWLKTQRNDLEMPARSIAPAIGVVLSRIAATEGCLLARMSGSGATCFGLYASRTEAEWAARDICEVFPDWWVAAASEWRL